MSGFSRSQFKATSLASLERHDDEISKLRPSGGGKQLNDFLKIEQGDNKFRVFPFHPDGGGSTYSEQKCFSWLPCSVPVRDEKGNKVDGVFEVKRITVINSKVHGGSKYDLVDEFLLIAKEYAINNVISEKSHFKPVWDYLTGNYETSIKPVNSWFMYASKFEGGQWSAPGLLEIKKTVRDDMLKETLNFTEGVEDGTEPFTSPEDGIAIIINKVGEKIDTRYSVKLDSKRTGLKLDFNPTRLEDEQLKAFMKLPSLFKLFRNTFTLSDLNLQLEGLKKTEKVLSEKRFPLGNDKSFNAPLNITEDPRFKGVLQYLMKEFEGKDIPSDDTADDREFDELMGMSLPNGSYVDEDGVLHEKVITTPEEDAKTNFSNGPAPVFKATGEAMDKLKALQAKLAKK